MTAAYGMDSNPDCQGPSKLMHSETCGFTGVGVSLYENIMIRSYIKNKVPYISFYNKIFIN